MKRLYLYLVSSVIVNFCFGQTPGVQWQVFDQSQQTRAIFLTPDSGTIVLGNDLFKLDKDGLVQWRTTGVGAGKAKIIRSSDSAYFVVGNYPRLNSSATDFGIVKFTPSGNIVWRKTFGGSKSEEISSAIATEDGGCIVVGGTNSNDGDVVAPQGFSYNTHSDCWIIKVGSTGNLEWQKRLGSTADDYARTIIANGSGGFFIGCEVQGKDGNFVDTVSYRSWVVNLDNTGNLVWMKSYTGQLFKEIKKANDGNFVLLANTQVGPNFHGYADIWMAKIDSNGSLLWENCYGGSSPEYCDLATIEEDSTGNIYLGVSTYSRDGDVGTGYGNQDAWIIKVNSGGSLVWGKVLGGLKDEFVILKLQKNGQLLASVNTTSSNGSFAGGFNTPSCNTDDTWLFRLDGDGNIIWRQLFGGYNEDWGEVQPVYNNQIYLYGYSKSFLRTGPSEQYPLWLTKVAPSNLVKVTTYIDKNSNGIKDIDERFTTDVQVTADKNGASILGKRTSNGVFNIDVDSGSYFVKAISNTPYFASVPADQTTAFPSYFQTDSLSFALQPVVNKQDLTINIIPLTPAKPGFSANYRLLCKNVGTLSIPQGEILFKRDSKTTLASAIPNVSSISGDTLKWNYTNLGVGDTASIFLTLQVAMPPMVNISDTLSYVAIINPVPGDETPANDTALLKQVVRGSFDPNDKAENNGGVVQPSFITNGTPLQYMIRFQNTGSDTAFAVTVRDTLSNRVDASSLQMIAASHPCALSIENGNILTWQFSNILLPDNTTNEPASHGYIVYTIKPKPDVVTGETIHNMASIYFDYNLPVMTNDAPTKVQANLSVLPQGLLHFYGNNQNGSVSLFWKTATDAGFSHFEIERSTDGQNFASIGSRLSDLANDYTFTDNVSGLKASTIFYRLKMIKTNGRFNYSNVLLFHTKNENDYRLSVYPNPIIKEATLLFESNKTGMAELRIVNATGITVSKTQVPVLSGKNSYPLTADYRLLPGSYFVHLIMNGEVSSRQFVVY